MRFRNLFQIASTIATLFVMTCQTEVFSQQSRWKIKAGNSIVWNLNNDKQLPHDDHLEMSGRKVSEMVTYHIDKDKNLKVNTLAIWPGMILKYDYRSYLEWNDSITPEIYIDGKKFTLPGIENVRLDGILELNYIKSELLIKRSIYP